MDRQQPPTFVLIDWCCCAIVFIVCCGRSMGAEHDVQLATRARLDLKAKPEVGELGNPRLTQGEGDAARMSWIPEADRPGSLTVEFAISPLGWRPFELQFTPASSGEISLELRGEWEEGADKLLIQKEVLWDALQCEGAELRNGSFEELEQGIPKGWRGDPQTLIPRNEKISSVEGQHVVKTWHNSGLATQITAVAGKTIILRGSSRALFPYGYREMKQVATRDTPAHRAAKRFLRGVNFGNFLEVPPMQDWALPHGPQDVAEVARQGFDHIRVPIGWHHYAGPAPEYRLKADIYRKVDPLVAEARRVGVAVILNIHHFDSFTSQPARERPRFVAIWRQIAEHYAAEPETVAFELLNEPKDAATSTVLNEVYAEAIQEIRKTNPARTIFVGPAQFNSTEELYALRLPDDDMNLIVTVHSYHPMYFTHQGASWTGADFSLTGVEFPGPPTTPLIIPGGRQMQPYVLEWMERYNHLPTEENPSGPRAFEESIRRAKEWSEHYGRPIHFGEFGAYTKASAASRAKYCRAVRERLGKDGIGWALWDWKAGFRYWNARAGAAEPGMREALLGKP